MEQLRRLTEVYEDNSEIRVTKVFDNYYCEIAHPSGQVMGVGNFLDFGQAHEAGKEALAAGSKYTAKIERSYSYQVYCGALEISSGGSYESYEAAVAAAKGSVSSHTVEVKDD